MFDFLYEIFSITNDFFAQFFVWDDDEDEDKDIPIVTQS